MRFVAHEVSRDSAFAIYEDSLRAHSDPEHPCHIFVAAQTGVPPDQWQLPVPFMGRTASAGVVFLGLNPSWNAYEPSPRFGADFDPYDSFWRSAFDSAPPSWPLLYRRYQTVGETAAPGFKLGRDALVLETIRFRSARSKYLSPAVWRHEEPMTLRLLEEVAPTVIVAQGNEVVGFLHRALSDFATRVPELPWVTQLEGQCFRVQAPWGSVSVVPTRHLSGAFGMSNDDRQRVGRVVGEALAGS